MTWDAERQVLEHQHRMVADLLDREWDPIGVYAGDDSPVSGEYETYAWEVLGHLRHGDNETEVASLLVAIKRRTMDLDSGPEDARAAIALVQWFQGLHA